MTLSDFFDALQVGVGFGKLDFTCDGKQVRVKTHHFGGLSFYQISVSGAELWLGSAYLRRDDNIGIEYPTNQKLASKQLCDNAVDEFITNRSMRDNLIYDLRQDIIKLKEGFEQHLNAAISCLNHLSSYCSEATAEKI